MNGNNTHEVYKFLRVNSPALVRTDKNDVREIPWNFAKFLVNKNGKVVSYINPRIEPLKLV